MTSTVTRRAQVRGVAFCWLVFATVGGLPADQENRCPVDDDKVVRVSIAVHYDSGEISVSPSSVQIQLHEGSAGARRVCWDVSNLGDGDTLHFKDKDPESPNYFPGLRRSVTSENPFVNSGNPAKAGTWRYALQVLAPDGSTVAEIDPEVVIKGPGS